MLPFSFLEAQSSIASSMTPGAPNLESQILGGISVSELRDVRGGWRGSAPGDSTLRTSGKTGKKAELAQKQRGQHRTLPL